MSGNDIDMRLSALTNSLGPFSPRPNIDQSQISLNMRQEIEDIEKILSLNNSSQYEYLLGIANRNYCSWYIRGDQRINYLSKTISHLQKAIDIDGNINAKIELSHILIEDVPVRDLQRAQLLVDELIKVNQLPDWMQSIVEKAKRWSGKTEIPEDNDFTNLNATPAVLREERTKLRTLLLEANKIKDIAKATLLASRLYNLGLLAAYLYGEWDASKGVIGAVYSAATIKFEKVKTKFNFNYLGKISNAGFLSASDYKHIEQLLGTNSNNISVQEVKSKF